MKLDISSFDTKIRLAPDVSFFTVPEGILFVKRDNKLIRISGYDNPGIPLKLFDFLRQPKRLIEIIDVLSEFRRGDLYKIIRRLYKLKLLKIEGTCGRGHRTAATAINPFADSVFLSDRNLMYEIKSSNPSYKRLIDSQILIIGDGQLAKKLLSHLERMGIHPTSSNKIEKILKKFSHSINHYDLIIAAEDYPNLVLFHRINVLCFEKRIPWLRLSFDDSIGYLGPLVVPGNTSCFNCCQLRLVSNSPNYEYQLWRYREHIPKSELKVSEIFADVISTICADEIIRYISNYDKPVTMNSIIAFDTRRMILTKHKVITHPNCIHCSPHAAKKRPNLNLVPRISPVRTRNKPGSPSLIALHDREPLHRLREVIDEKTGIVLKSKKLFDPNRLGIKDHHFFSAICSNVPRIGLVEETTSSTLEFKDREMTYSSSGSGYSPNDAELRALMESVERYSNMIADESRFRWAPYNDVKKIAINPADLILYREEYYNRHDFKCSRFSPNENIPWINGVDILSGKPVLIPADFVYYPAIREKPLVLETSNGAAAHTNKIHAILGALFEVIERDAFLVMWLNKLSMPILSVKSLPFGFKESFNLINDFGMEVKIVDITNVTCIPTIMAACYNASADEYPALVIGVASHVEPAKALQKALFEMEISLLDVLEKPKKGRKIHPKQISKPYDHKLFYLNPENRKNWNFMINSREKRYTLPGKLSTRIKNNSSFRLLMGLAKLLDSMNYKIVYADITPTDIRTMGVEVVKVFIPGFQPLYFGNDLRLSSCRLNEAFSHLNYNRASTRRVSELNLAPHPLP